VFASNGAETGPTEHQHCLMIGRPCPGAPWTGADEKEDRYSGLITIRAVIQRNVLPSFGENLDQRSGGNGAREGTAGNE